MELEVAVEADLNHSLLKKTKLGRSIPSLPALSKDMYRCFSLFALEFNRFIDIPSFKQLASQIAQFNVELKDWIEDRGVIHNIVLTYSLYNNLFSRLKYVSSLVLHRTQAVKGFNDIAKWFNEEKPKIRNAVPEKPVGNPKESVPDGYEEEDQFLQTALMRKQMRVYQTMARTTHSGIFPPKETLLQFKRKQLFQPLTERRARTTQHPQKEILQIPQGKSKFQQTSSTFNTATTANQIEEVKIKPFEIEEMDEEERQKKVRQEDILSNNIVEQRNEEDEEEEEQELLSQQEKKPKKKFTEDPDADALMMAEERIKDIKQSTLRRILKEKEDAIRSKLEQLDIRKNMQNWAATKSHRNSITNRKMETILLANRYEQLNHDRKESVNTARKEVPVFNIKRSQSSHAGLSLEANIENLRIKQVLGTYGKYIRHEINTIQPENEEQKEEARVMRATSLTSFCRQGKSKPFTAIVGKYNVVDYNDEAMESVSEIKQTLSKAAIQVKTATVYGALTVLNTEGLRRFTPVQIYPPKRDLFSNPFFPKHLYADKPKKKK